MSAPIPPVWAAVAARIEESNGFPMLRYHLQRAVMAVTDEASSREAECELRLALKIIRATRRAIISDGATCGGPEG